MPSFNLIKYFWVWEGKGREMGREREREEMQVGGMARGERGEEAKGGMQTVLRGLWCSQGDLARDSLACQWPGKLMSELG